MEKQVFQIGDRVFDIRYGWGKVTICADTILYPIGVQFDEDDSQEVILYTEDGKVHLGDNKPVLSFTEYTLKGFSHKRFFDYKNCIGKWGKFWDNNPQHFIVLGKLVGYIQNSEKPFQGISNNFRYFEPLTEEQIKMLKLWTKEDF